MGSQVASPTSATERPATRVDRAYTTDELGQVVRKRNRLAWIVVGGHNTRQPGLHRPRKRVARPGFTQRHRLGRGEPRATYQLAGCLRLRLQPPPRRPDVARHQGEPSCEV